MKRQSCMWLALLVVFLLVPLGASHAQVNFIFHHGATATGDGEEMDVLDFGTITVEAEGTFEGTVTVKAKTTPTSTWKAIRCTNTADDTRASTLTAAGMLQCSTSGLYKLKAEVTAYTSGTIKVKGRSGTQSSSRGAGGGGSGSGTVTSVDASGGVETASGSAITGSGTIRGALCVKHEVGTTYTVLTGDRGCFVTFTNADPVSVSLPEAGSTGFEENWYFIPVNLGAGTVTITPATSTIQGGSDLDLTTGKSTIVGSDGTDYIHAPGLGLIAEADTIGTVFSRGGIMTGAVSYATALKLLDENLDGYAWWIDPTDGPQFVCVDNDVPNACASYTRTLAAGQTLVYKNSGGSNIFVLTESTGAITSATIDARDNVITSRFYWDLDLCGVSPTDGTTVGHIWNRDPLSTAPTATAVVGTNRGTCWLNFPDSDGTYGVQITRQLPDGFVAGTLGADVWWNTTGTGNARFQIATICYADDEADDASFNTATVTTAAAGTSGRPNKQNVATIDTTGCVGGELIRIRFFRARTEASDTLNAALNVEKVFFKGWDAQ